MMRAWIVAAGLLAVTTGPSGAGIYSDDLSRCMIEKTTAADRSGLTRWMFAEASLNPQIKDLSRVTDAQRRAADQQFADLVDRLLLKDCRDKTVAALKYEGSTVLVTGFQTLGQVAGREMMTDHAVMADMSTLGTMVDRPGLTALAKEAGLPAEQVTGPAGK